MGNRRVILILLTGICCCMLLLWGLQRRVRFFPSESKVRAVLFEEPLDTVDRITVERGDARIELRRKGGQWDMYAPFPARVDQGKVARIIDAFENARVTDAHDFQELRRRELSLKEFGLAPAAAYVVLQGAQRSDALRIGTLTPLGKEVYVRMNELEQVLVVPGALSALLPRTADDLRSRKLVHCDRSLLRTIEIRTPGRPFIKLSKETGTWRLTQPVAASASDEKVEALLDVLFGADAVRFVWPTVSNVMDVAEAESALKARMEVYGFGVDAAVQIHVQESVSAVPAKILFGRPADDSDKLHYALVQGGDAVVAVSNDIVKAMQVMPSDLRDTRLFFEKPDQVKRLGVYFGDLLFVLTQTNALWRIQAPVSDVADQRVVKNTVEQLLRLKAETVSEGALEARGADAEPTPPVSHVELMTDQSSCRFTVAPDNYEGTRYRITFTNTPTVFHVASSNVPPALVSMMGLLSLRDKTVLAFPSESVRRITVKRGPDGVEMVQRDSGGLVWRLGEGVTGKVAAEQLGVWLELLGGLKADRIEKLGLSLEDLDTYGLRSAWLEVSLDVDAADAVRKTLLVGKEAGFGKRYAMVRGLDVLFVLDGSVLRVLATRLVESL